ncbi:MAG: YncE family protein [Spirochaetia bacterium]|nr:YncE family protein [Spirochaetia bacterium]
MIRNAKTHSLLFVLLILACSPKSAEQALPPLEKRHATGKGVVEVLVQPYAKTQIFVNGVETKPVKVVPDKTLGLVSLELSTFEDGLGSLVEARAEGFDSARTILKPGQPAGAASLEPALILNKSGLKHAFRTYVRTGKQPKSIAFIDNERMVVPLLEDDGIDVIHVTKGLIQRIRPDAAAAKRLGFVEPLVLADRKEVWISQMTTNMVHVFSTETLAHLATITVPGRWTKVLAYDPKRKVVYASNWASKNVSIIDAATRKVTGNLETGGVPRGMFVTDDGSFMYAAQFAAGNDDTDGMGRVLKLSLPDGKTLARYGVPGSKRHIVFSHALSRVFVSDMAHAHIEMYDPGDKALPAIKVFDKPNTIALSPDDQLLYVSCRGPNNPKSYLVKGFEMGRVYVLNAKTGDVMEWWEGGNQPTGLAVSPDGRYVAASDFLDYAVRVYERLPQPKP